MFVGFGMGLNGVLMVFVVLILLLVLLCWI